MTTPDRYIFTGRYRRAISINGARKNIGSDVVPGYECQLGRSF